MPKVHKQYSTEVKILSAKINDQMIITFLAEQILDISPGFSPMCFALTLGHVLYQRP